MMGTSEKVIKVPFKTNTTFNSTMMAIIPVIVNKKKTEKNMPFIAVFHKFT